MFYLRIKRGVAVERGGVVHFKEPRVTIFVDKHIESQDLKTHVVVNIAGLACSVVVDQVWLNGDESLDDHVSHFFFELFYIYTLLAKLDVNAI